MIRPWRCVLRVTETDVHLHVTDPELGDVLRARLPMPGATAPPLTGCRSSAAQLRPARRSSSSSGGLFDRHGGIVLAHHHRSVAMSEVLPIAVFGIAVTRSTEIGGGTARASVTAARMACAKGRPHAPTSED